MTAARAVVAATASTLLLFGCTRDDQSIKERLDKIDKRLESIEARIGQGGGARGNRAARRPRGPNPQTVYAVALGDSPWEGTKDAKVTLVEAFDFA